MRSFFKSEYAALFVGPAPAYRSHRDGPESFLRRLTKVQSVSYGFDINREEIKQIGHEDLLTRRINVISQDPAPGSNIDVNLEPVPVNFNFEYLPTCGLNEYLLNLNVVPSGHAAENSLISRHFGDKNFFLVLRSDVGKQADYLIEDQDYHGHYVLGIGNAFLTNYSLTAELNAPVKSSVGYQASNITLENYSGANYIPAIHLYDGKYKQEKQYCFQAENNGNEYDHPALLTTNIRLKVEELNIGGATVSRDNANAVGFNVNIDIDRKNLYGFGSMYPYDRKINLPGRGNATFNIIKREVEEGNLNEILKTDKPYKITVDFLNHCPPQENFCKDAPQQNLMTYVIDNAVLKGKSTSLAVNGYATVDLSFDFTLTRTNGFLISGGCLSAGNAPNSNDPKPCPNNPSSSDPDESTFCDPIIVATPTPSPTVTPSHTRTPNVTPSVTRTSSKTPTPTATNTITRTPTKTPTQTPSVTNTQTQTQTQTKTQTQTQTQTPTVTQTQTQTQTPTATQTQTHTQTPTVTQTQTQTPTVTQTQTQTPTVTQTQTQTPTVTQTQTQTQTQTPTVTQTATATPTGTSTNSVTPTITSTVTPSVTPTPQVLQYIRWQYHPTYIVEGQSETLTVYRDNRLAGFREEYPSFSIDYHTEDPGNSAVAGQDYIAQSGTLHFSATEHEKSITLTAIPKPGSVDGEIDEFFLVRLSNPQSLLGNIQITGMNPYPAFIVEPV